MSSRYTPDKWHLIKIVSENETLFKVLAGWSGSYLEGQSWKINSGIVKIEESTTHYDFHGYTGSVYSCHKEAEGFNLITTGVWNRVSADARIQLATVDEAKAHLKEEA